MIGKYILNFLLMFAILATVSCAVGQTRTPRHLVKKTITVDKTERTYYVFSPAKNSAHEKFPLVFVFHGGGGNALRTERGLRFTDLARRDRFIAVYPQAVQNNWNDGRESDALYSQREGIDDILFVSKIIDDISKAHSIDSKRIFATGPSNGGIFSHYAGAKLSDKFAAIAPVIGGIAEPFFEEFKPSEPVSVLIIQGTLDKLVPYSGGTVARNRGSVISTDKTLEAWRNHNGTDSNAIESKLPDIDKKDRSTVETYRWTKGRKGTEVAFYKVIGGGHTWPGSVQYAPRFIVGNVNRDFDATEVIWEFFKLHPKR